ncbi:MAG: alpha/beta hydrolase [Promethearchaeota archaeon]
MPEKQKVSGINWESDFLRGFVYRLLMILILPHIGFWVPVWVHNISGIDFGWELAGRSGLPSLILSITYLVFTFLLIGWVSAKMGEFSRFKNKTQSDQVSIENIEIPVGGGNFLPGLIIKGPNTPEKDAHVFVVTHGMGGTKEDFLPIGIPMTSLGFAVMFYDCRGHGEAKFGNKWDTGYIIKDYSKVLDYIEKRAEVVGDLDAKNIVAWGASMGGGVVLNEAYLDSRIKFVIAVCTWADFQMTATRKIHSKMEAIVKAGYEFMGINLNPTNLQNRMVSPIYNSFNRKKGFFGHPIWWPVDNTYRVMLGHCRNDSVVNFENFEINKKFLDLPPENLITFKEGDHAFAGMETALVGKMLLWLWMRGY